MNEILINRITNFLEDDFSENKSTDLEIQEAEKELNVSFDNDYKEFLKLFGGCYVGYCIYSFRNSSDIENTNVIELTKSFRTEGYPDYEGKYAISFDGSGNPILMNEQGEVILFDNDIGEYVKLNDSFSEFIEDNLPD
jgi:hypothetical protein